MEMKAQIEPSNKLVHLSNFKTVDSLCRAKTKFVWHSAL